MSFDGELNLGAVHRRQNYSVQLALPTKPDFIKSWRIFSFYFLQKCLHNCKKNYRNVYLHQRCETFVEVEEVPPFHGDEVAEPLKMAK